MSNAQKVRARPTKLQADAAGRGRGLAEIDDATLELFQRVGFVMDNMAPSRKFSFRMTTPCRIDHDRLGTFA